MKLSEILHEDSIIPELKAKDKKSVLSELAERVCARDPVIDKSTLVKVLLEREKLGSTGIGDGVAIPHGKLGGVSQPMISCGRSLEGVDFDAMDGQPAHLFFLLLAPEDSSSIHLQVLARLAKILKTSAFRKRLMQASNQQEIYRAIVQTDEESS